MTQTISACLIFTLLFTTQKSNADVPNTLFDDPDFLTLEQTIFLTRTSRSTKQDEVYLINKKFTEINQEMLRKYSNVTLLCFANNHISKIEERAFKNLTNLAVLYLNYNSLTKVSRDQFEDIADTLQVLNLAYNAIKVVDRDSFRDFKNLERLYLSGNEIETLESRSAFSNVTIKTWLYLDLNLISKIERGAFDNLKHTKGLSLANNRLAKITDGVFNNLELQTLILSHNKITFIALGAFAHMKNLKSLFLNGNYLNSWSGQWFSGLPKLSEIHLHENYLLTDYIFKDDDFDNFKSSVKIYVDGSLAERIRFRMFSNYDRVNFVEATLPRRRFTVDFSAP